MLLLLALVEVSVGAYSGSGAMKLLMQLERSPDAFGSQVSKLACSPASYSAVSVRGW